MISANPFIQPSTWARHEELGFSEPWNSGCQAKQFYGLCATSGFETLGA